MERSEDLPSGLANVTPIIPPLVAKHHFKSLDRVQYDWNHADAPFSSWHDLLTRALPSAPDDAQLLFIVNTRKAARALHKAITDVDPNTDGLFHLSTWMMPRHRIEVLEEVRKRLARAPGAAPQRCILVSTQCIEAGVDVDFPQVWREFGPYDSIVQAAGRCNRNGRLPDKGKVFVFRVEGFDAPGGLYETAIRQTELLRRMGRAEPTNPESFLDYFRLLYQLSVPDECAIQKARARLRFAEVDEMFQFIEDNTVPILILRQTIGEKTENTDAFNIYHAARKRKPAAAKDRRAGFFTAEEWRLLQPFTVNLFHSAIVSLRQQDRLSAAFDDESMGLYRWQRRYDGGLTGVGLDFEGQPPAEAFQA